MPIHSRVAFELDGGTVEIWKGTMGTLSNLLGSGTITVTSSASTLKAVDTSSYTLSNAITVNNTFNIGATGTGAITLSGSIGLGSTNRTFNVNNTTTISGTITESGGLTDSGTGELIFANPGTGILARPLTSLTISSGATVGIANPASHANRTVLVASALSIPGSAGAWSSKLDMTGNDMIVHNGSLANITSQLKEGYNLSGGGPTFWNGSEGIVCSTASGILTGLGVEQNSSGGVAIVTSFDGQTVGTTDVLVKYTYMGDANLDGVINMDDYALIDNGFNNHLTGWRNGDFNYDGTIDSNDYILIDNSDAFQMGSLAIIEQMPHWKIPGYAALYLPIYESHFGDLSTAAYDAALAAGTPAGDAMPAGLFATVPEPASMGLLAIVGGSLLVRRKRHTR
jgi:PEP-CTERM motif